MTAVPETDGAVAEMVEGQPTIPLRALGEKAVGHQPAPGPAARLVVLTTDLAGMEIALNKTSLVIGRTEENDVLLNHRSISRHHAKIVRDGEHYTIVDLQSANGIRVNGEDYERIEFNAGDIIELGHVKIRFVGPLEDFVFDPHAPQPRQLPIKLLGSRRRRARAHRSGGAVPSSVDERAIFCRGAPPPAPTVVAPPPVAAAPPPPAAPAAPPAPETPATILAAAKQAMVAEDWETARGNLSRIASADDLAVRREAAALGRGVEVERQGASMFAKFDEAANAKNYAAALSGYQQIPTDSVYKRRAQPRYEEARTLLVAEHMTAAEKDRAEGRCAEVRQEAMEVIRLEPHNQLIRDLSRLCRARPEPLAATSRAARTRPVAAAPAVERSESPARRSEPARTESSRAETAAAAEPEDAEALMKQAREAWLRQQCGAAMDLSRRALRAKPGWTDAYQILAVCSCSLKTPRRPSGPIRGSTTRTGRWSTPSARRTASPSATEDPFGVGPSGPSGPSARPFGRSSPSARPFGRSSPSAGPSGPRAPALGPSGPRAPALGPSALGPSVSRDSRFRKRPSGQTPNNGPRL